jgi:hypothetical protein
MGNRMKTSFFIAATLLVASVCRGEDKTHFVYTASEAYADEWVEVAKNITIKNFRFEETPWRDILAYIEKASKEGDTEGKGISIFVPNEFEAEFEPVANSTWTMQLSDNLNILTIFIEAPPPEWLYYPVAPRKVAVIPRRILSNDLQTPKE